MGTSQKRASETRAAIIGSATRLFQEHGYEAVGIADIMGNVGLTNGGFYKHFQSKAALAVEVTRELFQATCRQWNQILRESDSSLEALLDDYLRLENVDGVLDPRALGCGSAGDPERDAIRAAFSSGIVELAKVLNGNCIESEEIVASEWGLSVLVTMIGALVTALGMNDALAARQILFAARTRIRGQR